MTKNKAIVLMLIMILFDLRCSNECVLLTLIRKVGINGFPVMGSDDVESLGKPSMLHYIDGVSGEQLWLALSLVLWLLIYIYVYLSH